MDDIFLSLVVPAFNEEKRLGITLNAIHDYLTKMNYPWELIVVDDGSTDRTSAVAESLIKTMPALSVLRNDRNYGKGFSIRNGIFRCRGRYVGFLDADYKTPIEEISKMLPWLEAGFDVVFGSRGLKASQIEISQPRYRQLGAKLFSMAMHLIVGLRDIIDTQCGFKFFRHDVAQVLFGRQSIQGYMFDVEILYLAKNLNYKLKEVPIRWRNDPDSRLQLVRGNLRNIRDLIGIRRNRKNG